MFQTLAYYATAFHRSFVSYTTAKLQTLGLNFGSLFLVIYVGCGNRGHADDGIHRRADIVAHIGQELTLCGTGRSRVLQGGFQYLLLALRF